MTTSEARRIAEELQAFSHSAQRFSEAAPHLMANYPDRWVAVFSGEVVADAPSIGELIGLLKEQHIPPAQAMVRFLSSERRKFIL